MCYNNNIYEYKMYKMIKYFKLWRGKKLYIYYHTNIQCALWQTFQIHFRLQIKLWLLVCLLRIFFRTIFTNFYILAAIVNYVYVYTVRIFAFVCAVCAPHELHWRVHRAFWQQTHIHNTLSIYALKYGSIIKGFGRVRLLVSIANI